MLPQFSYSSADVKRVRTVRFGILSPEEVVRGPRRACFAARHRSVSEWLH